MGGALALLILAVCSAHARAQATGTPPKAESDWTRLISDMLPAIRACLEQPAVPVESVLKAWPVNRDLVGVRFRSAGGHRFDCIATQDGGAVTRLIGLMPEDEKVPGEGEPAFLPKREQPPSMRIDGLEQVTDAGGNVQGWLHYPGGPAGQASAGRIHGNWQLEWLGRRQLDTPYPPFSVAPDGKLQGESGCNRLTGTIAVDGASLSISQLATTRRACAEPVMALERRYLDALRRAAAWRIDGERLILLDAKGAELARLTRAAR